MPASPNRPTNRTPGPTAMPGEHAGEHNATGLLLNGLYKKVVGDTRTGAFTVAQEMQAEAIPVSAAAATTVTVPSLEAGTCVDLVQVGAGALTLAASGVTFVPEAPGTSAGRGAVVRLLWLTPTQVAVTGDLATPAGGLLLGDTFTGADGAPWSPNAWAQERTPGVGGGATIQGNAGRLQSGSAGGYSPADRIAERANVAPRADFDARWRVRFDATEHYLRWVYRSARADLDPDTCFQLGLSTSWATVELSRYQGYTSSMVAQFPFSFAADTWYQVRVRAVGTSHRVKVWADGSPEPDGWNIDATYAGTAAGHMGFVGASGSAAAVTQVLVDDASITTATASADEGTGAGPALNLDDGTF
ncbi:hypothetical protein GCM10009616_35650 [Microlunatus lacustris]